MPVECCRSCLATPLDLISLHTNDESCNRFDNDFPTTYLDRFNWCTNLNDLDDAFDPPTLICPPCLGELCAAVQFIRRCLRSDITLRDRWQEEKHLPLESGVELELLPGEELVVEEHETEDGESKYQSEHLEGVADELHNAVGAREHGNAELTDAESLQWIVETIDDDVDDNEDDFVADNDDCNESAANHTVNNEVKSFPTERNDIEQANDNIVTVIKACNSPETNTTIISNTVEITFGCQRCGEDFVQNRLLAQHQRWCDGSTSGSASGLGAAAAAQVVVKQTRHECTVCGQSRGTAAGLWRHAREAHDGDGAGPRLMAAPTVEVAGNSNGDAPPVEYQCDYCGRRLGTRAALLLHMRHQHTDQATTSRHLCAECGKTVSTAQRLRVHMLVHTGERQHRCPQCPRSFGTEFRLRNHLRTHTGERPYHCTVCGLMFAQGNALKCHMRTHTGERPYECGICAKRFSQNTILKTHMTLHTGKTVQCPDCDKKFSRASYLILHRREHTGEKPYACAQCPNRYRQQSHLSRHMDTHNGVKYGCTVCGKEYTKQWSLKMHMFAHGGQRPFACERCGATFVRKDKWRAHLAKHERLDGGEDGGGGGGGGGGAAVTSVVGDGKRRRRSEATAPGVGSVAESADSAAVLGEVDGGEVEVLLDEMSDDGEMVEI